MPHFCGIGFNLFKRFNMLELHMKAFRGNLKRVIRYYRGEVFKQMAFYLDKSRYNAADKQIIPRSPKIKLFEHTMYRMGKLQPPTPGKLTERLGVLKRLLKSKGKWRMSQRKVKGVNMTAAKTATYINAGLNITARVDDNFNQVNENYLITIKSKVKPSHGIFRDAIAKRYKTVTPQTARLRLQWERGIRGGQRKYLEPAVRQEFKSLASVIQRKINTAREL